MLDFKKRDLVHQAWLKKFNCSQSSSVGRLFDAAASLLGVLNEASYEGQAPMLLEAMAQKGMVESIRLPTKKTLHHKSWDGLIQTDWEPLLRMLLDKALSKENRARCFHESMAQALLQQALIVRELRGDFAVGLSGGVFQNRLLSARVKQLLVTNKFRCYMPEQVPMNDAGLSYGQIIMARSLEKQNLMKPTVSVGSIHTKAVVLEELS